VLYWPVAVAETEPTDSLDDIRNRLAHIRSLIEPAPSEDEFTGDCMEAALYDLAGELLKVAEALAVHA
jgi:hypothetical protein